MIKRICSILTAVVLTACLTACGDGEISEKEYQSFLSDMGISGVESAVEGAVYVEAFSNKIDTAYYQPDKIGGEQYRLIAQTCGEEKKTEMYGCYVLGEDEAAAAAMREAYIAYLQSAGYALIEETKTGDVIYAKGSHAVKVLKMNGKVCWYDEVAGQYGLYVFFY